MDLQEYKQLEKAGLLGDSFGMVNALFSALGFAFVALALFAQVKQIGVQMDEIRKSSEFNASTQRSQERQIRLSGLQALTEYYRAVRERATDDFAQHVAEGKEEGHIALLEHTLFQDANNPKENNDFKRRMLTGIKVRYLYSRHNYDEQSDEITDLNLPEQIVDPLVSNIGKDMAYISCFPIREFGFAWDVATVQSRAAILFNRSDIPPELEGDDRRNYIASELDDIFESYERLYADADKALA